MKLTHLYYINCAGILARISDSDKADMKKQGYEYIRYWGFRKIVVAPAMRSGGGGDFPGIK